MSLDLVRLYRDLYRIRRVEERLADVYATDKIQSPMHLSIGQELASVLVCHALRPTDNVFGTYRGHALYLAKGGDLRTFVAELYGKATGCTRGNGGSMHLSAPEVGLVACSAIVASTIPLAVGYALAEKLQGHDTVVVSFFGDGATEEGAFYESLNFAQLHRLPVLFVCENNFFAIHSPLASRQGEAILDRAEGILNPSSVNAVAIETDVEDVSTLLAGWVRDMRRGMGPCFLEWRAHRFRAHVGPGEHHTGEVTASQRDFDPLVRVRKAIGDPSAVAIETDVEREIDAAFAFAEDSPVPADSQLLEDVYG